MTETELENFYREHLEEDIIFVLSEKRGISFEAAMDLYYNSALCEKISKGEYGIQYLDAAVLAEMEL